uniref:Adenylate kinase 8 n=1 Tax=Varanus komodoensis TaxID=61221 RepID=A0A8D2J3L4_VARKO
TDHLAAAWMLPPPLPNRNGFPEDHSVAVNAERENALVFSTQPPSSSALPTTRIIIIIRTFLCRPLPKPRACWSHDLLPEGCCKDKMERRKTLEDGLVVLHAPDMVLIERNLGKRVDVVTGEVYHTTFDWPSDESVCLNLEVPPDISEVATSRRLLKYHQNYPGILQSFGKVMKLVNADQPCADVFSQVLTHVQFPPWTPAPFSPRILLCGPPGSGKSLQAALLVQKYGVINVCCGQLLKEAVADETKLGELIKPYFDNGRPVADNIVMKLLSQRLNQLDCHIRGWVLHGFPRDQDQAKLMRQAEIHPNRVFFLNVTTQTILERLCYRTLDPVTGERYHTLYKPSALKETNDRLLMHPRDVEETVMLKVEAYFRLSSSLESFFEEAFFINGDQDPQTVFEYIESYIVNPLPTKY